MTDGELDLSLSSLNLVILSMKNPQIQICNIPQV